MVEDELRKELKATGLDPSTSFRARMDQDFEDALAGRSVSPLTTSHRAPQRARWMWPAIASAAAVLAVVVLVVRDDGDGVVTPATTGTPTTSSTLTSPVTVAQMDVQGASLFGLQVGDVVDVAATIERIDALPFGPHTYDSGWYHVPDDPSIDSCYDDLDYRGVLWGDALVIFNGTDSSAEVMRWTVGQQDAATSQFFLGGELPTPSQQNDVVSVEGIAIGGDLSALQPPVFGGPVDHGDGTTIYDVADIPPQDGSLPQPFVHVTVRDGEVVSVTADVGRC